MGRNRRTGRTFWSRRRADDESFGLSILLPLERLKLRVLVSLQPLRIDEELRWLAHSVEIYVLLVCAGSEARVILRQCGVRIPVREVRIRRQRFVGSRKPDVRHSMLCVSGLVSCSSLAGELDRGNL